jgi:hypothetical protein
MADHDPDANITLNTGHAEDEWYRAGMVAQERFHALQQSTIVIPEALGNLVRVRHTTEEPTVVRILRGTAPKVQATFH